MAEKKLNINSEEYIFKEVRDYSIELATERSIPSVIDSFKDSQRKAVFIMQNKRDYIKTVSVAGEMISANIYLHGDVSAANSISLMAAPYLNNKCIFEGKGTFGTRVAPDAFASPRYTYVKPSKFMSDFILTDKNIIPMKENYDGSVLEPQYYLPLIPLVLLNGVNGIAVGWSTNILPHSLKDIIKECINELDGKKVHNLEPHYDYLNDINFKQEENRYEFYSSVEKLSDTVFKIKELAPGLKLEKVIETLDKLEDDGVISDYEDNTRDIIDISIFCKRGTNYSVEEIIEKCKLTSKEAERLVVVDFDGKSIKQYPDHISLIKNFVKFRIKYFYTRYNKFIDDNNKELAFLNLYKSCYENDLPKEFSKVKSKKELLEKISSYNPKNNNIDNKDIEKISELPSYKWIEESYNDVLNKIKELEDENKKYKEIISSEDNIKKQYKLELDGLLKLK